MDVIAIVAIVGAVSALIVSTLTHLKTSKCCGVYFRTIESHTPTEDRSFLYTQHNTTPIENDVFRPLISEPIPIPREDDKTRLINERRHRL